MCVCLCACVCIMWVQLCQVFDITDHICNKNTTYNTVNSCNAHRSLVLRPYAMKTSIIWNWIFMTDVIALAPILEYTAMACVVLLPNDSWMALNQCGNLRIAQTSGQTISKSNVYARVRVQSKTDTWYGGFELVETCKYGERMTALFIYCRRSTWSIGAE